MKIRSITLEGVGKFAEKVRVEGFGPGVNILAAENEAGKSTIFKALRACLFERHGTSGKEVKALATEGLSLPVSVSIELERDGAVYEIAKNFLKSPSAELSRGGERVARNREADERLWDLLGVQPGKRSADDAAFGLLWVGQGASFKPPEPAGEAETALNRAVQAEVGELVGGERARSLLGGLDSELGAQLTATGRPKSGGAYQSAVERRDELAGDLQSAENRLQTLRQDIEALEGKRAELERIQDPAETERLRAMLEEATDALRTGEEAARRVNQAATEGTLAQAQYADAEKGRAEIRARAERIERARADLSKRREEIERLEALEAGAKKKVDAAEAEIRQIDQAEKDRSAPRNRLKRISNVLQRVREKAPLEKRAEQLGEIHGKLAGVRRGLAGNPATVEALQKLEAFEQNLERVLTRLTAAAPVVEISLGTEARGRVRVDDAALAESRTFWPSQPLRISLDGVATVTVSPPAGAQDADRRKRVDLEGSIAEILAGLSVETAAEARAARSRRGGLEEQLRGLQSRLAAFDVSEQSLPAELAELRTRIETIEADAQRFMTADGLAELPSAEQAGQQLAALEEDEAQSKVRRRELEGRLAAANENLRDLSGSIAEARQASKSLQQALDDDLAVSPDEIRQGQISDAEQKLTAAAEELSRKREAVERLRQEAPDESRLESLRAGVQRLQAARETLSQQIGNLTRDIATLDGRIGIAGGEGLGEKVGSLREQHDLTAREVERHERRIATLRLLKETVEACYQEQRDKLHAPLVQRLRPFLHDVFPAAEIRLGEGFRIEALHRGGASAEDLERLSDGTREQIAVLVRLAMGALLCEQGVETPIILDDALVFSDDVRIEQMFNALTRAGKNQQVIIFTCRTRTFATLGARRLTVTQAVGQPPPMGRSTGLGMESGLQPSGRHGVTSGDD